MTDKKKYDVLSEVHEIDESLEDIIKNTQEFVKSESFPVATHRGNDEFMLTVDEISSEINSKLQDCSVITKNDLARLKKSQAFLFQTYTDVRQYRPLVNKLTTVMTRSKFPTVDSKFWQCKAEAEVHYNEMQREVYKWQRARVDLNELDYKISSIQKLLDNELTPVDGTKYDPNLIKFDLERLIVKRSQYEFEIKQLEKTIKYRIEEVTDWFNIAETFEVECKYSTRNPDEHLAETKLKLLHYQIEESDNEEERLMYKEQLDVLINLVKAKMKKGS